MIPQMDIIQPEGTERLEEVVRLCAENLGDGQPTWLWDLVVRAETLPRYEDRALYLMDDEHLAGIALYGQLSGALTPVRWLCETHADGKSGWLHRRSSLQRFPHGFTVSPDDYYLLEFVVDPPYRGKGNGGLLLDELCGLVAARGAEQMFLHATEMGRPLYEKHGFEPILDLRSRRGRTTFMGKRLESG